jgi:hypothetical protein
LRILTKDTIYLFKGYTKKDVEIAVENMFLANKMLARYEKLLAENIRLKKFLINTDKSLADR